MCQSGRGPNDPCWSVGVVGLGAGHSRVQESLARMDQDVALNRAGFHPFGNIALDCARRSGPLNGGIRARAKSFEAISVLAELRRGHSLNRPAQTCRLSGGLAT